MFIYNLIILSPEACKNVKPTTMVVICVGKNNVHISVYMCRIAV